MTLRIGQRVKHRHTGRVGKVLSKSAMWFDGSDWIVLWDGDEQQYAKYVPSDELEVVLFPDRSNIESTWEID